MSHRRLAAHGAQKGSQFEIFSRLDMDFRNDGVRVGAAAWFAAKRREERVNNLHCEDSGHVWSLKS
jgi:hypothetical protein